MRELGRTPRAASRRVSFVPYFLTTLLSYFLTRSPPALRRPALIRHGHRRTQFEQFTKILFLTFVLVVNGHAQGDASLYPARAASSCRAEGTRAVHVGPERSRPPSRAGPLP